jgi:CDP-diacylglycerol--glycerol-3-phosphate 3-phosphatidyltransferase
MTLPNAFTFFRIILIPIFVIIFCLPFSLSGLVASIIFTIAALTDLLDGYLARRLNQFTAFGAFLDPVADKLMVAAALVLLFQYYPKIWFTLPALIIISREILISALREWMAEMGKRTSVAVSRVGKFKTTLQMIAIIIILAQTSLNLAWLEFLGFTALYVSTGLTIWSMVIYLKVALPDFKGSM